MALNAKNAPGSGGNSNYVPMDPGTYPARLVAVIDLGLQAQRPFQGQEKKPVQEVAFTYEFADEFMLDEDGQELKDKPRWLTEMMPLYNLEQDKAKSTKRYTSLDPTGAADGDFSALLETPVMVTVVQNESKGKVYDNVAGISPMRAKDAAKCPALVNKAMAFDLDSPDLAVFNTLPKFIQERIKKNLEFEGSKLAVLLKGSGDSSPAKEQQLANTVEDDEDEHPY